MANVYINKKEYDAIFNAHSMVTNALEGCSADEKTKEGKETLDHLIGIIAALHSLERKMAGKNSKKKLIK